MSYLMLVLFLVCLGIIGRLNYGSTLRAARKLQDSVKQIFPGGPGGR